MKKILPVIFSLIAINSIAQIEKANVLFGGGFGFGAQQNLPNIGYMSNSAVQPFIQFGYKPNRTFGLGLDLNYNTNKSENNIDKNKHFSIAPSINFNQYHVLKGSFGWLLQEYLGMGFYANKTINGNGTIKTNTTSVFAGLLPGVYYILGEKKNWLLTANVGGVRASYTKQSTLGFETWNINTSLFQSYSFGFAYIFKK